MILKIIGIFLNSFGIDTPSTQQYCCVMIPSLVDVGGPWKVLPPGIHEASLEEVEQSYAISEYRRELFDGFKAGFKNLTAAGCRSIFLDGGFVGENPRPDDFDACWDAKGVKTALIDPVMFEFANGRAAQKLKYKGEFFLMFLPAVRGGSFPAAFYINYFQKDKHTEKPKGIIRVH